MPEESGILVNPREISVYVVPADPWLDAQAIEPEDYTGEGNNADDVCCGHDHQTNVSTGIEIGVSREHLLEHDATSVECKDGADYEWCQKWKSKEMRRMHT